MGRHNGSWSKHHLGIWDHAKTRAAAADASGAEAMRHNAAEVARRGAVAAYEMMAAASPDVAQNHTYADCMEAVGKALDECESMIRALPLPASDDAVEEAASVAAMLAEKRVLTVPTERVARWVAEHLAALRRAKGGDRG